MALVKIATNAVNAKLVNPDRETRLIVSDLLSYAVEGQEFMTKRPGWDGRSSFYSFRTDSFPAGFVYRVQSALKKRGHKVTILRKPRPEPLGPENPVVDDYPYDPRYDYQPETVRKLLRFGTGIAMVSTGGGKSRIARLAYARIKRKTLFLTTRSSLLYQFRDDCIDSFGKDEVGIVGDNEWDADKPLVCGMVQTLAQRLTVYSADELIEKHLLAREEKEKKAIDQLKARQARLKVATSTRRKQLNALQTELAETRPTDDELASKVERQLRKQHKQRKQTIALLREFEFVVAEEAHEAGSNSYFDVMQACNNAHYRLALTATPFMKQDAESNMRLMACTGGIMIRVTEKQLIDLGILATPKFMIVPTEKPKKLFRSSPYERAYKIGIVEHEWRNRRIVAECVRMSMYGLTSMVLVQRVGHGKELYRLLHKYGIKVRFIKGEDDMAVRKQALRDLKHGIIQVLIGTNILDVGVDVPSVGCIVLAGGGKAEVANRQRIGRGLRAKKTGPNICFVLDFMDEHNSYLQKHALQRRAIIVETPGFAENLLPQGQSWKPEDYGFNKLKRSS